MNDEQKRNAVADALRRFPHLGDAWVAAVEAMLDVEGTILAYWTDIPDGELERLRLRLREVLGGAA